ncbi:MAG: YheC/YheD family protein [Bacillaceae bacterium]|nr:YheC/YheD family protein [Bacillaceae bacterium]
MKKQMGILLDRYVLKRELLKAPVFEKIYLYEKYAKKYNIEPVYFHIFSVNLDTREVRGYVWNDRTLTFKKIKTPLPKVIHNRLLTGNAKINRRVEELCRDPEVKVFNPLINRNKLYLHHYLQEDDKIEPHLPETYPFSKENFDQLLKKNDAFFLKPATGSIGRGIIMLKKMTDDAYRFISFNRRHGIMQKENMFERLERFTRKRPYLIQKAIPLARYRNRPFDLRVTVQKAGENAWTISGMVGKVAPRGTVLTNLGRGGKAVPVDRVLSAAFPDKSEEDLDAIKVSITHLSLSICKHLENKWPNLADVGLDIGLDTEGKPWFIEANVRDQRYSFLSAGEKKLFKKTYRHPVQYAYHLLTCLDSEKEKETSG